MKLTKRSYKSEIAYTKGAQYLALTDKIWGVLCEDFGENWPRYIGTACNAHNAISKKIEQRSDFEIKNSHPPIEELSDV